MLSQCVFARISVFLTMVLSHAQLHLLFADASLLVINFATCPLPRLFDRTVRVGDGAGQFHHALGAECKVGFGRRSGGRPSIVYIFHCSSALLVYTPVWVGSGCTGLTARDRM